MFRGNSSVDREQIRRNIANYMGEVGRVVQAAVSRKRPKQREKWVPKPKGPRRGSGRTRSAAREEAVRPLLQIVELCAEDSDPEQLQPCSPKRRRVARSPSIQPWPGTPTVDCSPLWYRDID